MFSEGTNTGNGVPSTYWLFVVERGALAGQAVLPRPVGAA